VHNHWVFLLAAGSQGGAPRSGRWIRCTSLCVHVAGPAGYIGLLYVKPHHRTPRRPLPQLFAIAQTTPCAQTTPLCHVAGAAPYNSFRRVTNPHMFELGGVLILGTSGQNVDDMGKYTRGQNRCVQHMSLHMHVGEIEPQHAGMTRDQHLNMRTRFDSRGSASTCISG